MTAPEIHRGFFLPAFFRTNDPLTIISIPAAFRLNFAA